MTILAVGNSALGALALADEVEHHLHLLGEAQWLDLDGLRVVGRALGGLHRDLERDLGGVSDVVCQMVYLGVVG